MYDFEIAEHCANDFIEAFNPDLIQFNGKYCFAEIETEKSNFYIQYPDKLQEIDLELLAVTKDALKNLILLNQLMDECGLGIEDYNLLLYRILVFHEKVILMYVDRLQNAGIGLGFKKSVSGQWEVDLNDIRV